MRGLLPKRLRVHPGWRAGAGRKQGLNGVFVEGLLLPWPEAPRGGAAAVWSNSERLFLAL